MTRFPVLYELNTRILLEEMGHALGRPARLDDVPERLIEELAGRGFSWVWLLGIWQTGTAGRSVSRSRADWRASFLETLPDLREEDVAGSPFAVKAYTVNEDFGGAESLAGLRARLARRGLALMLDFVPNHVAPDHAWAKEHPEWLVPGTEEDLAREPDNYLVLDGPAGRRVFAHGRDPYFPGWPDTLQLNYRHPGLRAAMTGQLRRIADQCDGVRCDMAMLVLPDVFLRTWGERSRPTDGSHPVDASFWEETIGDIRRDRPGFTFLAEAYWDREWELQQQGFDYTYDKRLYDRLHAGWAGPVRDHLRADLAYLARCAHFLENHDEPRAAATFAAPAHRAAAVVSYLIPGLRFFHEGQLDGRRAHVSMHLRRRPPEAPDPIVARFYDRLFTVLRRNELHDGRWALLECRPAWDGNGSYDQFIAMSWQGSARLLAIVNYGPTRGQCFADLGLPGIEGRAVALEDLFGESRFERDGTDLTRRGLYVDLPAWGHHVLGVVA